MTDVGGGQYVQLYAKASPSSFQSEGNLNSTPKTPGSFSRVESQPLRNLVDTHNGYASVNVAEGRIILSIPSLLKDRLLDDEKVGNDWQGVRKTLKEFADKYIPKGDQSE